MTAKKHEEIKELAFYQAAWMRLFFVKGEISKITAEISVHEKQTIGWDNFNEGESTEAVKEYISGRIKVEYLKALVDAYRAEVEEIGKLVGIDGFKPA